MNQGMANLLKWLDHPEEDIWAMGTSSPARVLGLTDRGKLEPGMRAAFDRFSVRVAGTRGPAADFLGFSSDMSPVRLTTDC